MLLYVTVLDPLVGYDFVGAFDPLVLYVHSTLCRA